LRLFTAEAEILAVGVAAGGMKESGPAAVFLLSFFSFFFLVFSFFDAAPVTLSFFSFFFFFLASFFSPERSAATASFLILSGDLKTLPLALAGASSFRRDDLVVTMGVESVSEHHRDDKNV